MQLHNEIKLLDKYNYNEAVKLLQRYHKEYKNELIHRLEAEEILKFSNNITKILIVEGNVRGLYIYENAGDIYYIKAFILDPLVRRKKIGYTLWREMNEHLKDKPAIIGIIRNNDPIKNIIQKRGHYIGSGLSDELDTLDYYNLTFKELK